MKSLFWGEPPEAVERTWGLGGCESRRGKASSLSSDGKRHKCGDSLDPGVCFALNSYSEWHVHLLVGKR